MLANRLVILKAFSIIQNYVNVTTLELFVFFLEILKYCICGNCKLRDSIQNKYISEVFV